MAEDTFVLPSKEKKAWERYRYNIRQFLKSNNFHKVKKGILMAWGPELSSKYLDTIQLLYDSNQKENWEFTIVIGNSPSGKKGSWEEEINLGTFPTNVSSSISIELIKSNPEVFNGKIHIREINQTSYWEFRRIVDETLNIIYKIGEPALEIVHRIIEKGPEKWEGLGVEGAADILGEWGNEESARKLVISLKNMLRSGYIEKIMQDEMTHGTIFSGNYNLRIVINSLRLLKRRYPKLKINIKTLLSFIAHHSLSIDPHTKYEAKDLLEYRLERDEDELRNDNIYKYGEYEYDTHEDRKEKRTEDECIECGTITSDLTTYNGNFWCITCFNDYSNY